MADRPGHAGVFLCDHDRVVLSGAADAGGGDGCGGNDGGEKA